MKKKGFKPGWRELVINKSFDLIIVILGVSIAFQLNNLKQGRDNRELEKFYLESLLTDLNNDLKEYKDNLSVLEINHKASKGSVDWWELTGKTDSVGFTIIRISSIKTFEGHNNTYSTIRNENGLSIINDNGIRNLIIDHYRLYSAIERFESYYLNHIKVMESYFSQHLDYNHLGKNPNFGPAENLQTKNMVVIAANQLQNGIWRYQGSIDKAIELKKAIENYLNK